MRCACSALATSDIIVVMGVLNTFLDRVGECYAALFAGAGSQFRNVRDIPGCMEVDARRGASSWEGWESNTWCRSENGDQRYDQVFIGTASAGSVEARQLWGNAIGSNTMEDTTRSMLWTPPPSLLIYISIASSCVLSETAPGALPFSFLCRVVDRPSSLFTGEGDVGRYSFARRFLSLFPFIWPFSASSRAVSGKKRPILALNCRL